MNNYPPDHDPMLDSGEDPIEEVDEFDESDEIRDNDQLGYFSKPEEVVDEDPLGLGL